MDTWQFYQNSVRLWCWRHTDENGLVREAPECFHRRTDCIADAMRHGYLPSNIDRKPKGRSRTSSSRGEKLSAKRPLAFIRAPG